MEERLYIQNYLKIKKGQVYLRDKLIYQEERNDLKLFLKMMYKNLKLKYPKFFKMDSLSKLAFLSAEILLEKLDLNYQNIGIVFSNRASSLDTDRKHQDSINDAQNYFPSPSVFVYTLPNIGIGEISIRHQLKSENAFFIFEKYNANFHYNYEKGLIRNNKSDAVMAGWVDVDENNYEAFLYLVSNKGEIEHTKENLKKLYKS